MIRLETQSYRIEEMGPSYPKRFALDRKIKKPNGTISLDNIRWAESYERALEYMKEDLKKRGMI